MRLAIRLILVGTILFSGSGCQMASCSSTLREKCTTTEGQRGGNWSTTPTSGQSTSSGKCYKYSYYYYCAASLQTVVQQWYPKCRHPVVRLCYSNGQPVKGEKFCIIDNEQNWTGFEVLPSMVTDNCDQ